MGGRVSFDAPASGASADLANPFVTIDPAGRASLNAVANGLVGTYPVTARAAGGNTVAFVLTNQLIAPMVVGLQSLVVQQHPTAVVLTFSEPMDVARAEDRANYRLVWAGRDHRFGTGDDRVIPIRRARYDAASQAVSLRFMRRQPLDRTLWLTIAGSSPGGLTNAAGTPLTGAGTGGAGGDHAARLHLKGLRRPMRMDLLPDGGFETPEVPPRDRARTLFAGDHGLTPWQIAAGSVDIQADWQAAEGRHTLDLNGTSAGSVEQSFTTVPGRAYQLLFDYANNPDKPDRTAAATVMVTGAGTLLSQEIVHGGSTPRHMRYARFLGTFVADSTSATIRFASTTSGAHGIILDAVSVTAIPAVADTTAEGGSRSS